MSEQKTIPFTGACECNMLLPGQTIPKRFTCNKPGRLVIVEGQLLLTRLYACRYHVRFFRRSMHWTVRTLGSGITESRTRAKKK